MTLKKIVISFLSIVVPTVLIFFAISAGIFQGKIESNSMSPLLKEGDYTLSNKLSHLKRPFLRGEVIVFTEGNKTVVKRIIGLPGETITFQDGHVFINGKLLVEDYIDKNTKTYSTETFIVPAKSYFVLGDNRENSKDSRYMKNTYVLRDAIIGKVFYYFNGINLGQPIPTIRTMK